MYYVAVSHHDLYLYYYQVCVCFRKREGKLYNLLELQASQQRQRNKLSGL